MDWSQDNHWVKALEVAKALSSAHKWILVPNEFVGLQDNFYPVEQAKQLEIGTITGFVIRKDQISYLPKQALSYHWFLRFHSVWMDDVFAAFSTLSETCHFDWDAMLHFPSFEENRKRCAQEQEENIPYLLDSSENRLLQTIFPHKNI